MIKNKSKFIDTSSFGNITNGVSTLIPIDKITLIEFAEDDKKITIVLLGCSNTTTYETVEDFKELKAQLTKLLMEY